MWQVCPLCKGELPLKAGILECSVCKGMKIIHEKTGRPPSHIIGEQTTTVIVQGKELELKGNIDSHLNEAKD